MWWITAGLAEALDDAVLNAAKVDPVQEVRRLTGGKGDVIVTATPAPRPGSGS
jgi:hypothetical protein